MSGSEFDIGPPKSFTRPAVLTTMKLQQVEWHLADYRVYLLSRDAELLLYDLATDTASDVLIEGPEIGGRTKGYSGLAGPLTDCESGFVIVL